MIRSCVREQEPEQACCCWRHGQSPIRQEYLIIGMVSEGWLDSPKIKPGWLRIPNGMLRILDTNFINLSYSQSNLGMTSYNISWRCSWQTEPNIGCTPHYFVLLIIEMLGSVACTVSEWAKYSGFLFNIVSSHCLRECISSSSRTVVLVLLICCAILPLFGIIAL